MRWISREVDAALPSTNRRLFEPIHEQAHISLEQLSQTTKLEEAKISLSRGAEIESGICGSPQQSRESPANAGRLDEAMEHYSAALRFDPRLAQAHNNLGVLLLARDKRTEGAQELREARRLNPGDLGNRIQSRPGIDQQQQWNESAELLGQSGKTR